MSTADRDCGVVLDEMSIDQSLSFCNNNKKMFGNTTVPGQNQKATHGLVVMLVGINSRWKQVVAYHFTGNCIPEDFQKSLVLDVIHRAEEMGLKVKLYWNFRKSQLCIKISSHAKFRFP